MTNANNLADQFERMFGRAPRVFSAPGRVNLIGEHTDYNDGFVLPMAIDRRTCVAAAANHSGVVRVHSLELGESASFPLGAFKAPVEKHWLAYIAGVTYELEKEGLEIAGADLLISSNVPIGAGLSSSAALEIAAGTALSAIAEMDLDKGTLARAAQKGEHTYAGTNCGIMDQLTSALGKKSHALLIDCRSLEVKPIETSLPDTSFVICNTNVRHELASSEYNERRRECEEAVQLLRNYLPTITALRDVNPGDLNKYGSELPDVLYRRAHHVVTENARTLEAAISLVDNDAEKLGRLIAASHQSLRDDYEVSIPELDLMVELAAKCEGVLGARMTGGGFGGCTVNLVKTSAVASFQTFITREYEARTKIRPDVYVVFPDDGVTEIELSARVTMS